MDWIEVTADNLVWRRSLGTAYFGVLRDNMWFVGPVCRAHRCAPEGIPVAAVVFVAVTTPPRIPGQDVWSVVPGNMWQPEQWATMCAVLPRYAAALRKLPAAKTSSNRPAASLAFLQCWSRAWCWVIAVLEPHSSALCLYDHSGVPELMLRPADLEALRLGTLGRDCSIAVFLKGTVVGTAALWYQRSYGGDAFDLVMVEERAPWLRAFASS